MRQSGKDSYPNYSESKFLDPCPLGEEDEVEAWLKVLHDLPGLRNVLETEELKRQLKIHLGLITDDTTDFDPTEFQKPAETDVAVKVTEVPEETVTETVTETPAEAVVEGGDTTEPLLDDDFLNELRGIS